MQCCVRPHACLQAGGHRSQPLARTPSPSGWLPPAQGWADTSAPASATPHPTPEHLTSMGVGRSSSPIGIMGLPPSVLYSMPVCGWGEERRGQGRWLTARRPVSGARCRCGCRGVVRHAGLRAEARARQVCHGERVGSRQQVDERGAGLGPVRATSAEPTRRTRLRQAAPGAASTQHTAGQCMRRQRSPRCGPQTGWTAR